MKKVWKIEGLDCANCAAKMEDAMSKVPGVEQVRVNFMAKTVTLTAADADFAHVTEEVLKAAAKAEPDAEILVDGREASHEHHEHHHEHKGDCCCGHDHCDDDDDDDDDDHDHDHHHHEHEHDHKHEHSHDHGHEHGDGEDNANVLYRVVIAVALAAVARFCFAEGDLIGIALNVAAFLFVAYDILWKAVRNITRGQIFDENFLMTVASVGAMCMQEFTEAVAVMALYQIGEWFQDRAVDKSRASIAGLMDIRPDYANVIRGGETVKVDPNDVKVGEMIVVKPGEKIPLDGVISEGLSSLNTVALTGESLPRDVRPGDHVISGCINLSGVLTVEVTSVFGESTVARILELVESSGDNKAKAEQFISKFARWYTPAVCAAAVLLAVVPPLFIDAGNWSRWITQALSFLVISCPCALVISVPLSFFSGIGGASRKGILIKGANYMEVLANLDTVAFDKTGTLTHGVFKVTAIHPDNTTSEAVLEEELLETAALAESFSTHPISRSLLDAYGREADKARVTDVKEIAGHGIEATVDGRRIAAGNDKLMASIGLTVEPCEVQGTIIHVAADGRYMGHIVISDEVKPTSRQAIADLKNAGVGRLVMLTGDRKPVAEAIGRELGMTDVRAELLPAGKVTAVEGLLGEDHKVGFVGDGINDAPVLRRADLGIAMGALGSDAAIEAADVVLMDDDPAKLPLAVRIARRTMGIVHQNIVFALAVKAVIMILGFLGIASMWLAVFADVGVAMIAILNAMRAMRIK